jgi:SAM-dependent methyltransferase/ribosomal protein S18 acetylase RimI-like enzyme
MTSRRAGATPGRGSALEVLRTRLRSFWFAALGHTVYRRLVVMECRLDEPIVEATARAEVVVALLTPADIDTYATFRPDTRPAEIHRRLLAGHQCFVVRHQGQIVHAGWAATRNAWIEYLGRECPLEPGDVYQFDSYTTPAFRGLDLAAARVTWMARYFRDAGYRRLRAVVWPENARAFRPLEKAGYRSAGAMGYVGLARWRHHFHRRRAPSRIGSAAYWDEVVAESLARHSLDEWRAYMQRVYGRLVRTWLPARGAGRGLKTDLFEEAITSHHVLPALGPGSVGLDCSPATVRAARERLGEARHLFVVADLRAIPLRAGVVDRILAGSSLDHFVDKADIATSLAELARVLTPGGTLVVTFDNPHNPVVWLRNRLPFGWLNRAGIVPYYVGQTYGRAEGRVQLESVGLTVTHVSAVAHAPRAPAIGLVALAERLHAARLQHLLGRALTACEWLGQWPTRYRTGYYLVFRAQKGGSPPPLP